MGGINPPCLFLLFVIIAGNMMNITMKMNEKNAGIF